MFEIGDLSKNPPDPIDYLDLSVLMLSDNIVNNNQEKSEIKAAHENKLKNQQNIDNDENI